MFLNISRKFHYILDKWFIIGFFTIHIYLYLVVVFIFPYRLSNSTMSIILILLAIFIVWVTYFIWSRKRALSLWKRLGVPGPEPNFWFGNAKQFYGRTSQMEVLQEWADKYGRVYGYYIGLRPQLNVTDLDIVKEIYIKQFSNFVNRPTAQGGTEQNLSQALDEKWKAMRRIMNPIFTTRKLKAITNVVNKVEDTLMEILDEKTKSDEIIPAYRTSQGLTFEVITKTAFAINTDCQRNENDPLYKNLKLWMSYPFSKLIFYILMFPALKSFFRFLLRLEPRMKFWAELHTHVGSILKFRRANPDVPSDLLGLMLEASEGKLEQNKELKTNMLAEEEKTSENVKVDNFFKNKDMKKSTKPLLTDVEIMDNLLLFLAAGFDSTSNTIAFAHFELAKNPEFQEIAYEEIIREIGQENNITIEECKKLVFVEQIIYEILRMYPPVPVFLHREAKNTVTIKGIKIPKGTVVETPPWLIHRDQEYWPNPEKFDPFRFSPENKTEIQNDAFLAWGMGPRMCLGARFSLIEATTALAKIIREYRIVPSEKFNPKITGRVRNILLNPTEEIYVRLQRR